jgi:hypothetical protein
MTPNQNGAVINQLMDVGKREGVGVDSEFVDT